MGLLDDAIREHLELKRRRGADPTEIARAEQEALGPVRRERAAPPEEPSYDEAPEHHDHDYAESPREAEPRAGEDDIAAPAPEPPLPREPEDATRVIRPDEHAPDAHAAHTPQPPADEPQRHEPPVEHEHAPDPRRSEIVDQPTTEYRIEDLDDEHSAAATPPPAQSAPQPPPAPEHHGDPADSRERDPAPEPDWHATEDVLEETPDFLQETPEHDRLWFEQRPPRDFDFDG